MSALEILNELNRRGIDIELAGDKIRLHGSEDALDDSLVGSIRMHKAEIITCLSTEVGAKLKSRPIWCAECLNGGYKTSREGKEALWCNLANRAVFDMQKCVKGFWVKNEKGWPLTVH